MRRAWRGWATSATASPTCKGWTASRCSTWLRAPGSLGAPARRLDHVVRHQAVGVDACCWSQGRLRGRLRLGREPAHGAARRPLFRSRRYLRESRGHWSSLQTTAASSTRLRNPCHAPPLAAQRASRPDRRPGGGWAVRDRPVVSPRARSGAPARRRAPGPTARRAAGLSGRAQLARTGSGSVCG